MMPVCSAGSNHVGASVTWKGHVICDCAAADVGTRGARESSARSRIGKGRQALMDFLLSEYGRERPREYRGRRLGDSHRLAVGFDVQNEPGFLDGLRDGRAWRLDAAVQEITEEPVDGGPVEVTNRVVTAEGDVVLVLPAAQHASGHHCHGSLRCSRTCNGRSAESVPRRNRRKLPVETDAVRNNFPSAPARKGSISPGDRSKITRMRPSQSTYRPQAARGEVQPGISVTMIRTPA